MFLLGIRQYSGKVAAEKKEEKEAIVKHYAS